MRSAKLGALTGSLQEAYQVDGTPFQYMKDPLTMIGDVGTTKRSSIVGVVVKPVCPSVDNPINPTMAERQR